MEFTPHVRLMKKDKHGHKQQVFPETDIDSVIGLGDSRGDLMDRLEKVEKRLDHLENVLLYH